MADIQVLSLSFRNTTHSKNKTMSSLTARNSLLKKLHPVSGTTKMQDLDSKLPKKPSKDTTSIKNVPSLAMSP